MTQLDFGIKEHAGVCESCGAKTVEYRHGFSVALAVGLIRLYNAAVPVNLKTLGLTRNQWDNFQKLRYWGLAAQCKDENGNRRAGFWVLTTKGKDFVEGKTTIQDHVWTYRGRTVRYDGAPIAFPHADLTQMEGYAQRADYASEAVPRE
jgi:hypothetical protein